MTAAGSVEPRAPEVPSWRLIVTLAGAGAIVGLCIVLIYRWTLPTIEAHKAAVLRVAIAEVLHAPDRSDTLWLVNNALTITAPANRGSRGAERVYLGYDRDGRAIGFAIMAAPAGFVEPIRLIFGYEPASQRLLGMKVLESKETPGIADKIEKPVFTAQFGEAKAPLRGIKGSAGGDPNEIAMISGATVSSRAIIKGINTAIARWQPVLDAYMASPAAPGGQR